MRLALAAYLTAAGLLATALLLCFAQMLGAAAAWVIGRAA